MNFRGRHSQHDDAAAYNLPPRLKPPSRSAYPTTSFSARGARRMEEWQRVKEMGGAPVGPDGSWIAVPLLKNPVNGLHGAGVGARGKVELKRLLPKPRYSRASNPIVATQAEQMDAIRQSVGGFRKKPELVFNPTTMEVEQRSFNDQMRDGQMDPNVAKQVALRSQPWSLYANNSSTGGSTKGYGKAMIRRPGGGQWQGPGGGPSGHQPFSVPCPPPPRNRIPQNFQSTAMQIALGKLPNENIGARTVMNRGQCSPRDRNSGGVNPITGRAYDANIELQHQNARLQALERFHQRHNYSHKLSTAAKDLLSPRPENGMPWIPATKRTVGQPRTSLIPDIERCSDLPNTSKTVYKQNGAASEYKPWRPSRKVSHRPADKAVAGLLGRGRQVYLPLTGPDDIWKPKKDKHTSNYTNGPSGPRF